METRRELELWLHVLSNLHRRMQRSALYMCIIIEYMTDIVIDKSEREFLIGKIEHHIKDHSTYGDYLCDANGLPTESRDIRPEFPIVNFIRCKFVEFQIEQCEQRLRDEVEQRMTKEQVA